MTGCYQRVLFPVDLSRISLSALPLATDFAKLNSAKLCFIHVASSIFPDETMYGADCVGLCDDSTRPKFESLRPSDESVEFEHIYLHGNAGPEIVGAGKTGDLIVLSTHGHSAMFRLVMGSVAQYVLRHANCPVILARGLPDKTERTLQFDKKHFVTEIMDHVAPVRGSAHVMDVSDQLNLVGETAAPVVDENGICIGILTRADIDRYRSLKNQGDCKESNVEIEDDGQGRRDNDCDNVQRYMTNELISVNNNQSLIDAILLFEANPKIHHLVVVDQNGRPVGIVDSIRAIATVEYGRMKQESSDGCIEVEIDQ